MSRLTLTTKSVKFFVLILIRWEVSKTDHRWLQSSKIEKYQPLMTTKSILLKIKKWISIQPEMRIRLLNWANNFLSENQAAIKISIWNTITFLISQMLNYLWVLKKAENMTVRVNKTIQTSLQTLSLEWSVWKKKANSLIQIQCWVQDERKRRTMRFGVRSNNQMFNFYDEIKLLKR